MPDPDLLTCLKALGYTCVRRQPTDYVSICVSRVTDSSSRRQLQSFPILYCPRNWLEDLMHMARIRETEAKEKRCRKQMELASIYRLHPD